MKRFVLLPVLLVVMLAFGSIAYAADTPVVHNHADEVQSNVLEASVPAPACPNCYGGPMKFWTYTYQNGIKVWEVWVCYDCLYYYMIPVGNG